MPTKTSSLEAARSYELRYQAELLESAVFSAIVAIIQHKKATEGLTQSEVAFRCKKDKTQISKILSEPGNWTLRTVAELSYALDVDLEFVFVDKRDRSLTFGPSGVERRPQFATLPTPEVA